MEKERYIVAWDVTTKSGKMEHYDTVIGMTLPSLVKFFKKTLNKGWLAGGDVAMRIGSIETLIRSLDNGNKALVDMSPKEYLPTTYSYTVRKL